MSRMNDEPIRCLYVSKRNARKLDREHATRVKAMLHCGCDAEKDKNLERYWSDAEFHELLHALEINDKAVDCMSACASKNWMDAGEPEWAERLICEMSALRDSIDAFSIEFINSKIKSDENV